MASDTRSGRRRRTTRPCIRCSYRRGCRWFEMDGQTYWRCTNCGAKFDQHVNMTLYAQPFLFSDVQVTEAARAYDLQ